MSIPGTVLAGRPWPFTRLLAPDRERLRAVGIGLAIAAALAAARLAWNLVYGNDLFLDSWVLVHVLGVLDGDVTRLPRATLTLQYPISYLPALPLSFLFGPFVTVKYIYPVVSSLAAVPGYLLLRRGPAPILGVLGLLFLPDLAVKALTGTPQGFALPLFVLAVYFALTEKRLPFVLTAAAILFTHHLTGMVTLVLYYTVVALPHSREPGWLRREAPYLVFFSLWPLYWAWSFYWTDQSYIWPIFLTLALAVGASSAVGLYLLMPRLNRLMGVLGGLAERLPGHAMLAACIVVAALGWLISERTLDSPGLSSAAVANRAVVAVYAALLFIGALAVLARRHLGLTLLFGTLGWLGFLVMPTGCTHVFDGLRLADYAILGGLVALFAPGLNASWRQPAIVLSLALVFAAGGLRLQVGRDRLFAISDAQYAAAGWIRDNTRPNESVATDTKMSLLVLGKSDRNATFEGSRWLFDGSPVGPTITSLNTGPSFAQRPIAYVLLTDYMLTRGADVGWFGATTVVKPELFTELDGIGRRVYQQGGVTIWRLDQQLTAGGGRRVFPHEAALDVLTSRMFGAIPLVGKGSICD
jgi:hypothetical protein